MGMDPFIYNKVKDVNAKIRQFVAGEAITKGQIVTADLLNKVMINKVRSGVETILSIVNTNNKMVFSLPINATQSLVFSNAAAVIVTTPIDGSTPYYSTPFSIGAGICGAVALTATTFLIMVTTSNSPSCVVVSINSSINATTITMGALVSLNGNSANLGGNFSLCLLSPTRAIATWYTYTGGCGSTTYRLANTVNISGTTVTIGTAKSLTDYINFQVKLSSTQTLAFANASKAYVLTTDGTTITASSYLTVNYSYLTSSGFTINSVHLLDSTHVLLSTSIGLLVAVISGGNTVITYKTPISPLLNGSILTGSAKQIDAFRYVVFNGKGCYIAVVTKISSGDWCVAVSNVSSSLISNVTDSSSYPLSVECCVLGAGFIVMLRSSNYSLGAQIMLVIGNSINDYSYNLGIAMETVSQGDNLDVFMGGISDGLFTGLIPGAKYSNFNGYLALSSTPNQVTSITSINYTQTNPSLAGAKWTVDNENGKILPYAVALSSTEVEILEPLSSRGVNY